MRYALTAAGAVVAALLGAPLSGQTQTTATADGEGAIAAIDGFRDEVEANLADLERKQVSLSAARAQVRQKWRSMDAYLRNGSIVRIKLYPHQGISERTEEFYYRDGQVVLVFVEDEGAQTRGRAPSRSGKTYYFDAGRLVRETNRTGEQEITDSTADAARLMQEATEYLDLAMSALGDGHAD